MRKWKGEWPRQGKFRDWQVVDENYQSKKRMSSVVEEKHPCSFGLIDFVGVIPTNS